MPFQHPPKPISPGYAILRPTSDAGNGAPAREIGSVLRSIACLRVSVPFGFVVRVGSRLRPREGWFIDVASS